jgi:hypothetical protein
VLIVTFFATKALSLSVLVFKIFTTLFAYLMGVLALLAVLAVVPAFKG